MRSTTSFIACIVIWVALAGCSSSGSGVEDGIPIGPGYINLNGLLTQPAFRAFSAFDGHHAYQLVATIPSASDTPTATNPDPVAFDSLVWTVDHVFVAAEAYPDIRGAILLTTKRAGETKIRVSGAKRSGEPISNSASLTITQANPDEWTQGDKLFHTIIDSSAPTTDAGMSGCTPPASDDALPKSSTCGDCHGDPPPITPAQTAGYTDDDLIDIFTKGQKPPGYMFSSDLLKNAPMPECVFQQFHSFDIDDDAAKRGLVLKLRSLAPRTH